MLLLRFGVVGRGERERESGRGDDPKEKIERPNDLGQATYDHNVVSYPYHV